MSHFCIAPIVEGKGEVAAVPILLRRLWAALGKHQPLHINEPLRVKIGSFLQSEEYFQRYVELAARKVKAHPAGGILILLDCEDECAGELGPHIVRQAARYRRDVNVLVVLACREYETWFLTAARSLRRIGGLPPDLTPPMEPEKIRGAKEWLRDRLPYGYEAVEHQPLFTHHMNLQEACANNSFKRLRLRLGQWAS